MIGLNETWRKHGVGGWILFIAVTFDEGNLIIGESEKRIKALVCSFFIKIYIKGLTNLSMIHAYCLVSAFINVKSRLLKHPFKTNLTI